MIRIGLGTVALALTGALGAAEPAESASREWSHPEKSAPRSLHRWFADLPAALQYSEVRHREGDDPRWADPAWDDRDWKTIGFWDLRARSGINWIRFRVRMGDRAQERIPGGVMISSVIAYDVFWDGVLLGSSGVPANSREGEMPGRVDSWFSIPAHLLEPGEHVVAVRSSSYRCEFPAAKSGLRFLVDSPATLQAKAVREAIVPTVAAGAMFMVGLASWIMWLLAARRGALLLLGAMCLCIAAMQGLHSVRWFFQYPSDWHYGALVTMTWLVGFQGVFMVLFVVVHFALPGRWWLLGGLVPTFALVSWLSPERMNLEGVYMLTLGATVSLACVIWAAWKRRRDAWPSVIGILISTVLFAAEAEDFRSGFFLKFLPAMLGMVASLALHLHDERRRAQAAQLAAARLELEMLKKNIQPHFLLNTLATIMETIEQDPKTAAALVEALAGEFRILSRVAGEKLISLGQEIDLCRSHLRVMSLRNAVRSSLTVQNVDERTLVPPALLHTLVENGFTHLQPLDGRQDFELRGDATVRGIRYTLLARGARFVADRQPSETVDKPREGTGLRYIKARLEESFTGRWKVEGGPVSDGWQTVIELEHEQALPTRESSARVPGALGRTGVVEG